MLLGLGLQWGAWAQGRWHLHPDDQLVGRDVIAHIDNGVVRMGNSWNGEVAYTLEADGMWDETKVFKGSQRAVWTSLSLCVTTSSIWVTAPFPMPFCTPSTKAKSSSAIPTFRWIWPTPCVEKQGCLEQVPATHRLWGVYKEGSRAWSDRVAVIEGAMDAGAIIGPARRRRLVVSGAVVCCVTKVTHS